MAALDKYAPYAQETAMCVDLALDAVEENLRAEMAGATADTAVVLERILDRVMARRSVLDRFLKPKSVPPHEPTHPPQ